MKLYKYEAWKDSEFRNDSRILKPLFACYNERECFQRSLKHLCDANHDEYEVFFISKTNVFNSKDTQLYYYSKSENGFVYADPSKTYHMLLLGIYEIIVQTTKKMRWIKLKVYMQLLPLKLKCYFITARIYISAPLLFAIVVLYMIYSFISNPTETMLKIGSLSQEEVSKPINKITNSVFLISLCIYSIALYKIFHTIIGNHIH